MIRKRNPLLHQEISWQSAENVKFLEPSGLLLMWSKFSFSSMRKGPGLSNKLTL
ncbi:unnamed protein product [Dovyalis caffra]|uniref:Uncharacterized protein n=1 Tax=Dovyalis caffra TaxID=77055 RepID=A0AAV1RQS3_9ROSI|nr:unnamed protein product [Dovyalis caffra]